MFVITAVANSFAESIAAPGASSAFVSTDLTVQKAVEAFTDGRFMESEKLLDSASDRTAAEELREIIRRTRREYGLDRAAFTTKLRDSIPDVTDQEIDRWLADKSIQHRTIDGQLRIFRREPGHLLRFNKEAMARRDAHKKPATQPTEPKWELNDHLARAIQTAAKGASAEVEPVKTTITYTLTVKPTTKAKAGSKLDVWLPFPQEYARQRDVKLLKSEPANATIAPVARESSSGIEGAAQRTVHLQRIIDDPTKPQTFQIQFEFTTSAFYPNLDKPDLAPTKDALSRPIDVTPYLAERAPHIVFTKEIREKTMQIVGNETDPLKKARLIFNWLDENLRWTPEEEYCVIPNLSMHGFTRGKGDCGVASMTFITMCRIAGVPARWQSGWTTKPQDWNMHDWSEIYIEPWGWLPVDASNGRQKSDNPAVRDFYFGHTDSYRLIVNLDYGQQLSPPKQSFRSEPLDFQRGEVELDGKNLYFDEWDYEIEFERDRAP